MSLKWLCRSESWKMAKRPVSVVSLQNFLRMVDRLRSFSWWTNGIRLTWDTEIIPVDWGKEPVSSFCFTKEKGAALNAATIMEKSSFLYRRRLLHIFCTRWNLAFSQLGGSTVDRILALNRLRLCRHVVICSIADVDLRLHRPGSTMATAAQTRSARKDHIPDECCLLRQLSRSGSMHARSGVRHGCVRVRYHHRPVYDTVLFDTDVKIPVGNDGYGRSPLYTLWPVPLTVDLWSIGHGPSFWSHWSSPSCFWSTQNVDLREAVTSPRRLLTFYKMDVEENLCVKYVPVWPINLLWLYGDYSL